MPRDSVHAGLHLHRSWRPDCEPPTPPFDPWMRGAVRIVIRPQAAAAAASRDGAPERPRRQGTLIQQPAWSVWKREQVHLWWGWSAKWPHQRSASLKG